MVKKRRSSSDTEFKFDVPSSPDKACEAQPGAPDSPGSVFLSSEAENGVEEKKKVCRSPTAQSPPPTPSSEAESPDPKRAVCLRSKSSFDGVSLASDKNDCKTESKNDSKLERKKSSSSSQYKANLHFHKLFLEVPTEEPLRQSFTCALQKEILYQGKLFVSENWICFHSKVFGKDTKISIPAFSVTLIKKTKTALLVPNALIIATVTDRYIFVSLLSRDSTYKLLKSVCGHLDNISVGNSPNPSSLENSFRADRFRADRPSSLPLDFNDEFSDLDGVVQQRRQDLGGYSSSGSQTPESENSRDFHVSESQTVLGVSKGEAKPTRADAQVNRAPEGKAKGLPAHGQSESNGILHKVKSQNHPNLRHILIFYAVVVCALILSTFYMRYRINTLEEQLGSLTSIMDTHHAEYRTTYRNCLRMATDRPDCVGQRDTSRFPLKKVLREAPGERSLLAGGASGGEAPRTQPRAPWEVSSSAGGGRVILAPVQ
ncbi:GRAM domain-containing protein 2B isoform X4 [Pipistrellus kuhlii]|uniref:GRAM domain-containing protein 2B isoform X4 n=1 Tax=Pipistrellus kuhlii TaxID=59472 RepID=UPI00174F1074|nr:GRAM domain-containing protein 2B isoform X4 [Pipistrellus kuhlii]